MGNKYTEYLEMTNFLERFCKSNNTISEVLFKYYRTDSFCITTEGDFFCYLNDYLEEATEKEYLSIDIILQFVEIESIVDFMKEQFIRLVRIDNTFLEESAYETLISLICEPAFFFNLYKTGRKD